jgi:hypothetical protein
MGEECSLLLGGRGGGGARGSEATRERAREGAGRRRRENAARVRTTARKKRKEAQRVNRRRRGPRSQGTSTPAPRERPKKGRKGESFVLFVSLCPSSSSSPSLEGEGRSGGGDPRSREALSLVIRTKPLLCRDLRRGHVTRRTKLWKERKGARAGVSFSSSLLPRFGHPRRQAGTIRFVARASRVARRSASPRLLLFSPRRHLAHKRQSPPKNPQHQQPCPCNGAIKMAGHRGQRRQKEPNNTNPNPNRNSNRKRSRHRCGASRLSASKTSRPSLAP